MSTIVVENKEKSETEYMKMSKNFGQHCQSPFVLAPMEDVTDVVFRHVVKEAGAPDVFLQNLLIRIVIVILKEKIVYAGASFYRR